MRKPPKGFGPSATPPRSGSPRLHLRAPAWVSVHIERVTDADRLYFETHPTAHEYTRAYCWGEFWPLLPAEPGLQVVVTRIDARTRTRYLPAANLLVADCDKSIL